MVQEEESADVIRKQWVILFARRKMQSRELPGLQMTGEKNEGKQAEKLRSEIFFKFGRNGKKRGVNRQAQELG